MTAISVIIPVYNDAAVLPELYRRLKLVLNRYMPDHEIIFVDDASIDLSLTTLIQLSSRDERVVILSLSENSGQSEAIAAGLDRCCGDIILIMDSDLQDRPDDIPLLVNSLQKNNVEMVIARWRNSTRSLGRSILHKLFFLLINRFTLVRHDPDLGVFRVMKKSVLDYFPRYAGYRGTRLSLLYRIGVSYLTVSLDRDARFAGRSGYNFRQMVRLGWCRFWFNLPFQRLKSENQDVIGKTGYKIKAIYRGGEN
ncbi:MAG: glycosyltransferase [Candidatus Cloacimonetes bacterium]|nr:glycosyltransferase [Candidatus Cloacimonadota bacterium]